MLSLGIFESFFRFLFTAVFFSFSFILFFIFLFGVERSDGLCIYVVNDVVEQVKLFIYFLGMKCIGLRTLLRMEVMCEVDSSSSILY